MERAKGNRRSFVRRGGLRMTSCSEVCRVGAARDNGCMRTWRIVVWVLLLAAAGVVAWMRFGGHGRKGPAHGPAVGDLSVTSPLNVPGGAPEPEEAYAIYSALYQEKSNEALAFANYTSTDIPQLDGSCLKPETPDERVMAEAFEAANKQSHPWEQKFATAQGYRLLTARETNEAMECLEANSKRARRLRRCPSARLTKDCATCGSWARRGSMRSTRERWFRSFANAGSIAARAGSSKWRRLAGRGNEPSRERLPKSAAGCFRNSILVSHPKRKGRA